MIKINTRTGRLSSAGPNISNSPKANLTNCPDCDCAPDELHARGCNVERCARCGGQAISCACIYEVNGIDWNTLETTHPEVYFRGHTPEMEEKWDLWNDPRRGRWTGMWPGRLECREYGWWAVFGPGLNPPQIGWISAPEGTPGATEDLNRLYRECVWDQEKQRMVKR